MDLMPRRLQRKRTKGWRKPDGSRFCGRPTKYGNPFRVGKYGRNVALELFDEMLANPERRKEYMYPSDEEIKAELKGKDLLCWCAVYEKCHVDQLLRISNS